MDRDKGGAKVPPEVRKKMEDIIEKEGISGILRFRKVPRKSIDMTGRVKKK